MPDYKILFLDIDGTLVTANHQILDSSKAAIAQVQDQGIEVFLATGRPLHEIEELAHELEINSFIGYNGAYAKHRGKDIFQEPLHASIVDRYLQITKENHHELVLYTNTHNLYSNMESPIVKEFINYFLLHKNKSYDPSQNENILGITLMNLSEEDLNLYEERGIHLSQVNVEGLLHCYDVIRGKVNKGYGVQMVLEHLNIHKDQSIAFGDGMNDKEMLMNVGDGFAMGNAHPELFQYAKHKTTEVDKDGVYNGLKTLGLIK